MAHAPLDLPVWTLLPFIALLLSIGLLPLAAHAWWHKNRNKAIVAGLAAASVTLYLLVIHITTEQNALVPLAHEILQYVSFVIMLGSLFTVSGGIVWRGDPQPTPWVNAVFLGSGALLANVIGTTGASVLLIRPLLRINRPRQHARHVPIFFIFMIGNVGGLLTPLGDPPLFLGFLNGVPFAWTLHLWKEWLLVNGLVLLLFTVWDTWAYRREPITVLARAAEKRQPWRLEGIVNLPLLGGVIAGALVQGAFEGERGDLIGTALMAVMGVLSLVATPKNLRAANGFSWSPMVEVAVLFFGIFVSMVPALELLKGCGGMLGLNKPWEYFWLTGGLSAFLDNAPTYLAFATLASGGHDLGHLAATEPHLLAAISTGAVFMGSMTYIGNGPNFMVKAIAEEFGFAMPGFFGYLGYSCVCLLPIFVVLTLVFF